MRKVLAALSIIGGASVVLAQPTINGTIAGDAYGPAAAVQTIETGFGDNFSEWNAAYGTIVGNRLYMAFTGNLEANFNKLEILIDGDSSSGFGVMPTTPGNDGAGVLGGMTFDTGFTPETHLIVRRGTDGNGAKFDLDYAELGTANFNFYERVFGVNNEGVGQTGTGANAFPIRVGYDNSNLAGIGGNTGAAANQAAALAVQTGLELSIRLEDVFYDGSGPIKVMLIQNGDNHRYLSNQFLGGLPVGTGNLGSDGAGGYDGGSPTIGQNYNWNNYAGDQCFPIPEPSTLALLALGGLALVRRR